VSLAVTASSAFPPVLSPVVVEARHADFQQTPGADLVAPEYHERLMLTDGGAYDNLGLETVWNRYDTVLVGDAGAQLGADPGVGTAWHAQAMRAFDIATDQARALRKRALIDDYRTGAGAGAYWGIGTDPAAYELAAPVLPCRDDRRKKLAAMRTRLNHFTEEEQCELINWGYAICDTAMRRHVLPAGNSVGAWPYPAYALDRP
jgi:NTE family protein